MYAGALLGVLFIPFEIFGSWQIYQVIKKENPKLSLLTFMLAIYFAAIGIVVHMLYGIIGVGMQLHTQLSSQYTSIIETHFKEMIGFISPLATVVIILHVLSTSLFVYLTRQTKNVFPSWLLFVNPLTIYVVLASPYFWWPLVGNILAPAAFNLSYGIFFCITNYYIKKQDALIIIGEK